MASQRPLTHQSRKTLAAHRAYGQLWWIAGSNIRARANSAALQVATSRRSVPKVVQEIDVRRVCGRAWRAIPPGGVTINGGVIRDGIGRTEHWCCSSAGDVMHVLVQQGHQPHHPCHHDARGRRSAGPLAPPRNDVHRDATGSESAKSRRRTRDSDSSTEERGTRTRANDPAERNR